jgi:hypothetical protein
MLEVRQESPAGTASTEAESRAKAFEDADAIIALRKSSPFQSYFLRRLREKRDALSVQILEDDRIAPEEREKAREKRKAFNEVLAMMDEDMAACRKLVG